MEGSFAAGVWKPLRRSVLAAALLALGCSSAQLGSAGSGGSAGSAGSDGGMSCPPCSAGEYCQASSGKCVGCGDLSQLDFGPPEPLSAVNSQNPSGGLRFPRVAGPSGGALLYVAVNHALTPPGRQIWFSAKPDAGPGNPVSASTASASGPLYVQFNYVSGTKADVLFDRVELPGQTTKRDLFMASLSAKDLSVSAAALPLPFNTPGTDDYSIAVASDEHRAWWMSDRQTGAAHLVTTALEPIGTTAQDVSLSIQIDAQKTCTRAVDDATPWVTPDGSVMLFSAERLGADCHPSDSGKHGLYAVRLDQSGRPDKAAAGQPLDVNQAGVDQTDPSLSPDLCMLYYAADDGSGFKLYRAPRR